MRESNVTLSLWPSVSVSSFGPRNPIRVATEL